MPRPTNLSLDPEVLERMEVTVHDSQARFGLARYATSLNQVFEFLSNNSDRRYTDRALMQIRRMYDRVSSGSAEGVEHRGLPITALAQVPFEYDEETEVKRGGTLSAGIMWPTGKIMLASHADARRSGVASRLYRSLVEGANSGIMVGENGGVTSSVMPAPVMFLGRDNAVGQQFALSLGLMMSGMNSQGSLRYSTGVDEDEF